MRLLLPVAVLTVMAFLYYRPISSYLHTRSELGDRRAQVASLRAEKARLERRLARTMSDAALAREARRIGYVKPGERLFIVKGIGVWRRRTTARVALIDAVRKLHPWTDSISTSCSGSSDDGRARFIASRPVAPTALPP